MQYDPSRGDYHHQGNFYANQYPPVNQPQFGAGNFYQPYPQPQSYSQYPQQPVGGISYIAPNAPYYGQAPPYQQQQVVVVPMFRPFMQTQVLTAITSKLRAFLIISGIIYILLGISIFGLEIANIVTSYWTLYSGLFTGGIILGMSISMFIIARRTSYSMTYLVRTFAFVLILCIIGVILSAFNFATSKRCSNNWYYSSCDNNMANILKMVILILASLATVHTIINLIIASLTQRKSVPKLPASSPPGY